MAKMAYLYPDPSTGLESEVYTATAPELTIGRHPDNDLLIAIESVSRHHARLAPTENAWQLTDLDSSNGTYVNGELLSGSTNLTDGDVIIFGKATFTFQTRLRQPGASENEHTSGLRIVGDEEDSSVILSTRVSDQTPFKTAPIEPTAEENLERLNQRLLALYQLSDVLRGASRRDDIIAALVDLVFHNLPADRAVALRVDSATDDLTPEIFRFRDGVENRQFVLSRAITRRALTERVAVLSRDVRMDDRFKNSESIMASDIRSAICVPLAGKRNLMGLLFLDTRESEYVFTEEDLAFVSALATDAAMTLENLSLMEENIRQERLAAVGQTISGLAHNIKNILQLARGGAEMIDNALAKKNFDDIATMWPITRRSIERMQALTHEMLDFSRQSKPDLAPADINEVVRSLAEMFQTDKRGSNVKISTEFDESCGTPEIDAEGLGKALMNLLSNSLDALNGRENSQICLRTEKRKTQCVISVKDNGPGIPDEIMSNIFQPFFSTKGSKGNGLGLSMTRKYLEDMGANLEVKSSKDHGTEFTIILPQ